MKQCSKCKITKSLTDFHIRGDNNKPYGVCKACMKAKNQNWYQNNAEAKKQQAREWAIRNPEKVAQSSASYEAGRKEQKRLNAQFYSQTDPLRVKAHKAVYNAIRRGDLVRPNKCQWCKAKATTEAHHEDYNKPLEVHFICRGCHQRRHRGGH